MRLSTERDRDDDRSIAVLHAAFDAGITFLDTADAYCWDATETGHNERLIARASATWPGAVSFEYPGRNQRRPDASRADNWIPDGRARHLAAACAASLRRSASISIPRLPAARAGSARPLATSVRALDALQP